MDQTDTPARNLGGGLILRSVAGPEDVERVAAFDALIHGVGTESTWRAWMTEHPHANPQGWLFVEEQQTKRVIASLCLFSWRLHYGGVELRAAEMGVVGTLEEYRTRGLQRALNTRYDELLRAGGYHLSHIQGIAYFYRQFGYEYALPLEAWWRLEAHMAPATPPAAGHTCRPATLSDLPALIQYYDESARAFDIAVLRDTAIWRYLLGPALTTETAAETWMVIDAASAPAGYIRIARHGFGDGLIVAEASLLSADAAVAALQLLGRLTTERAKPYIRLNLPDSSPLVVAARAHGGYDGHAYAWQIRLPDPALLLRTLAPVLERRLAASMYAGLTRTFVIDLYRRQLRLHFSAGRLTAVQDGPATDHGDLRLPPLLLAPLLLGYRSLAEIAHMYPDASAASVAQPLVETLFPKLRTWLYQQY